MYKSKNGKIIEVEELSWQEGCNLLTSILPELANVINSLSPGPEFVFYKASYSFGEKIIHNAEVFLPIRGGESISFNDESLPEPLRSNLSFDQSSSNPLGIMLNKNSEFYLYNSRRIMPYQIAGPGHIFGLSRALDNAIREDPTSPSNRSPLIYDLNAGARSLFMLPKISDNVGYAKLNKEYNLHLDKPKGYEEHWQLFKEIANKSQADWRTEVLYFSKQWLTMLGDSNWLQLFGYFSKVYKLSNSFWHTIQSWETTFSRIQHNKKLEHYSAYTLDTIKHLFTIAAKSAPAFRPSTDDSSAPIKHLQEIYRSGYGLHEYSPIIMEITQFSQTYNKPLYYSLNHATLPQFNPEKFKGRTILNLELEVQHGIQIYQNEILTNKEITPPSLFNAASMVDFSYFHHDPGQNELIQNSSKLANLDLRFIMSEYPGAFSCFSAFMNGCIKLTPKSC